MSALSQLQQHLQHYRQLPYHQNNALAQKLIQVQAWQRHRIHHTHDKLFAQPNHQAMAHYFIEQLYGGEAFDILAQQLERILPKAQKIEMLAPSAALETGVLGIYSAINAIELDMQLAQWLLEQNLEVNEANMVTAYRTVNAKAARERQIQDLKEMCYRTDKYINSFMLQKGFKLAKGTAYKHGYQPLYDFIAEGFAAMKPLKSVASFIDPFCEKEFAIIDYVHSEANHGHVEPPTIR